ncbi:MAG: TM1266 family iron-only hydrogenase system putative regulator [Bacteroidota bacterium]|nr:TM1266 family iron-only hydrogenase system putative regulator [Bacteroidota bacterium]
MLKEKRIGTTLIVIDSKDDIGRLNAIITEYSHLIVGRQGIPLRHSSQNVISLVFEGLESEVGAFSGKLGRLRGIKVKTALMKR